MNLFKNQKGFTLVETMMAIGISTGAALIVYKVLGESQKGQAMVENRDDINQIHREVVGKFTDRLICTNTMSEGIAKNLSAFKISDIKNQPGISVLKIPHQFGKIALADLQVLKVDREKNLAEVQASYTHRIGGKDFNSQKNFRLELSFKDGQFEGCISRGTLGLDPKDACDLVVGNDANGQSYFYNGKCNFAKGACEQSGRVWNDELLKCNFSEDDLEALRREICSTYNLEYSEADKKCLPSQELINMVEEFKKLLQNKQ